MSLNFSACKNVYSSAYPNNLVIRWNSVGVSICAPFIRTTVLELRGHRGYTPNGIIRTTKISFISRLMNQLARDCQMHLDLKMPSETKIHHCIVLSWKRRISWENSHFSAILLHGSKYDTCNSQYICKHCY